MIAGGVTNVVTAGLVILIDGAACPTGYTRLTALDNRFLQANATYNAAAGGASTHQHPSHSHGAGHNASIGTSSELIAQGGQGTGSGTTANPHDHGSTSVSLGSSGIIADAADNTPGYATILICQKD